MLIAATHKSSLDKEFIEISDIDSFYCKGYFLRPILGLFFYTHKHSVEFGDYF
jgi:hypothetical protein